jgi:ABC-type multidrug transport system fused ATPase/permease subunit
LALLKLILVCRTTITIAHRLSTIRKADVIYVMEQGKIVEIGGHDALLERKERYYALVQAQL